MLKPAEEYIDDYCVSFHSLAQGTPGGLNGAVACPLLLKVDGASESKSSMWMQMEMWMKLRSRNLSCFSVRGCQ